MKTLVTISIHLKMVTQIPISMNKTSISFLLFILMSCFSFSLSAQTTELTNWQLLFNDASDVTTSRVQDNAGQLLINTEGALTLSADSEVVMLNDDSEGRFFLHQNGRFRMGISPQDFSGRFGKLGVYSDSDPDVAQLTLLESGDANDFTRLRFLNDENLFDANLNLQNWTIAAKIGNPSDYRFIVGLNGSARMRYIEDDGTWEFLTDPSLNSRIIVDEIELNGSDFAEKFEVTTNNSKEVVAGYVVTIDPDNAGNLKVADQAYDKKVVGIISGANGVNPGMIMGQEGTIANGDHPVALSGRVYVSTTDINGKIQPGDMLTTSTIAGHAMKATKKKQSYGSIIGKAMTSPDENGYVLVLVNLQ